MVKSSVLIAKVKRSGINSVNTFIWEDRKDEFKDDTTIKLLLDNNEDLLIAYLREDDYKWFLSNKRLFIPTELKTILLSDITSVSFNELKDNPSDKMINIELNIYTGEIEHIVYFEEKTWHLFYDIFRWITVNNKTLV